MSNESENNKRIAKNTLVLYLRMILMLLVGLYTSRVILDSLGVEDFGIYNLVGGFVSFFNIFRAGLLAATQRFISYDLGRGDKKELRDTFSTLLMIFITLSAIIVVLAEAFGIWFIDNKLTIPSNRLTAAHWVFQFSLFTLVLTFITFPYNALIISHEKMTTFAYISIFETIAKLVVAYAINISSYDKLIVYSALLCIVQLIIRLIYTIYCNRNYEEANVTWKINWSKVKKIYAFTGWELLGSLAVIGYTQGLNILLGMFFTPVVNAARGVAVQIQNMIVGFVTNFQMAINPQITKSYASEEKEYMVRLIFYSSKLSFFLLFIVSLPIILEAEELLAIWLVEVPEYTVVFFRLIIVTTMIDAVSNPIITSVEATGNIKKYQIIVGSILLMILPISYIALKQGAAPYAVFIVHIAMSIVAFVARLILGSRLVGFSCIKFINLVLLPIGGVVLASVILPTITHLSMRFGLTRLLIVGCISVISIIVCVYFIGLRKPEREKIVSMAKGLYLKMKR